MTMTQEQEADRIMPKEDVAVAGALSRKAVLVWGEVKALIHDRADNPEWGLQAPALIYDALQTARDEGYRQGVGDAAGPARKVLDACDKGRMVARAGAGGMTIEANIKASVYNGVPAWPIEEAREELAAILAPSSALAEPGDGWLPIKDAPRDGTKVMVTDGLGVYGGAWFHPVEEAWLDCDGCTPTMYQPLPSPPRIPSPGDTGE